MRLLIHDANVLMDLLGIGLLERALDLPYDMETTDLVLLEIEDPGQAEVLEKCIASGRLVVIATTAPQVSEIGLRMEACRALSLADCSVLYYAEARHGVVLTGDGRMRKEAASRNQEVHGTLWVLERMVESGTLPSTEAAARLEALVAVNPRLPRKDCDQLLETWREYRR